MNIAVVVVFLCGCVSGCNQIVPEKPFAKFKRCVEGAKQTGAVADIPARDACASQVAKETNDYFLTGTGNIYCYTPTCAGFYTTLENKSPNKIYTEVSVEVNINTGSNPQVATKSPVWIEPGTSREVYFELIRPEKEPSEKVLRTWYVKSAKSFEIE